MATSLRVRGAVKEMETSMDIVENDLEYSLALSHLRKFHAKTVNQINISSTVDSAQNMRCSKGEKRKMCNEKAIIKELLDVSILICRENYAFANKFKGLHEVGIEEVIAKMTLLLKYTRKMKRSPEHKKSKILEKAQFEASTLPHYKTERFFK